jgi:hypothetical protein
VPSFETSNLYPGAALDLFEEGGVYVIFAEILQPLIIFLI